MKQTYVALKRARAPYPDQLLNSLPWCNKCENHVDKLRSVVTPIGLEVLTGVNADRISLYCYKCTDTFRVDFADTKRMESVTCKKCQ